MVHWQSQLLLEIVRTTIAFCLVVVLGGQGNFEEETVVRVVAQGEAVVLEVDVVRLAVVLEDL